MQNTDWPPPSRDDTRNGDLTLAVNSVLGPPLLANVDEPAWKRLASRAFLPREVVSLIEAILMSGDEVKMIGNLCGDDAQSFIDVIHEVPLHSFPRRGLTTLIYFGSLASELSPSVD